jgi:hypothetical protein
MAGEAVISRLREIHRAERRKSAKARPGTGSIKIESPLGSNNVKYNTWFYDRKVHGDAFMWCSVYQAWAAAAAKIPMSIIPKAAGVLGMRDFFQKRGRLFQTPKVGDLVIFIFATGGHHIGFVEKLLDGGKFLSIEGNVSSRVMRVLHNRSNPDIAGYGRPDYEKVKEDDMTKDELLTALASDRGKKVLQDAVRPVVHQEVLALLKKGFGGLAPDATDESVKGSQSFLFKTIEEINSKLPGERPPPETTEPRGSLPGTVPGAADPS